MRTGGLPVTFVPSCVRNVMRLIDILPAFYGIGMLSIFVTRATSGSATSPRGTLVVRDRPGGGARRSGPEEVALAHRSRTAGT